MGNAGTPLRILVTAFEPFGPPGKPRRPENASERVLRAWEDRAQGRHPALVFPVDPRCEVSLARALHSDPAGIISLGEAGLPGAWDTNVEIGARDLPVTHAAAAAPARPPAAHRPAKEGPYLASAFAPGIPLLEGMEREDRIGSYWCNRIYFRVLQWCALFRRPAVFLHLRVDGDRARQVEHLSHVVASMERALDGKAGGRASITDGLGPRPRRADPGGARV